MWQHPPRCKKKKGTKESLTRNFQHFYFQNVSIYTKRSYVFNSGEERYIIQAQSWQRHSKFPTQG